MSGPSKAGHRFQAPTGRKKLELHDRHEGMRANDNNQLQACNFPGKKQTSLVSFSLAYSTVGVHDGQQYFVLTSEGVCATYSTGSVAASPTVFSCGGILRGVADYITRVSIDYSLIIVVFYYVSSVAVLTPTTSRGHTKNMPGSHMPWAEAILLEEVSVCERRPPRDASGVGGVRSIL